MAPHPEYSHRCQSIAQRSQRNACYAMVSLWPFKGDANSAASFEKTLAALSTKIQKATTKNDSLRQSARRFRVGLLIYAGFAYILIFVVLTLVTGYQSWGTYEYGIIAGGPPLIYGAREAIIAYYNWRMASSQGYLDGLYKERDTTIQRLKAATKYDSTQQLLDKYGQSSPKSEEGSQKKATPKVGKRDSSEARVFRQPPPTANIQRGQRPQPPNGATPPRAQTWQDQPGTPISASASPVQKLHSRQTEEQLQPGFAPNAFPDAPPQHLSPSASSGQTHWYDRILDALLGEDEAQAHNRIALICRHCRLVNGQAPPGTKALEEVGRWRCSACGGWNGEESETSCLMQQISARSNTASDDSDLAPVASAGRSTTPDPQKSSGLAEDEADAPDGTSVVQSDATSSLQELEEPEPTPSRSTRSKTRRSNKDE